MTGFVSPSKFAFPHVCFIILLDQFFSIGLINGLRDIYSLLILHDCPPLFRSEVIEGLVVNFSSVLILFWVQNSEMITNLEIYRFVQLSRCWCKFMVYCVVGPITALEFSIDSRYLVATGGKHVNVFYNITGYQTTITELEDKKKVATTTAMKDRLDEQINEAR